MSETTIRVLFVCLGNICRSPLAEGLFRHHVQEAGLAHRIQIRSAGTGGWHVGKAPDDRMSATARLRGIDITHQRARQLSSVDLEEHELILVMDRENLRNTRSLAAPGGATSHVSLFREFDPEPGTGEVPDPYYGGEEGFVEVFEIVERTSRSLLEHLREEYGL